MLGGANPAPLGRTGLPAETDAERHHRLSTLHTTRLHSLLTSLSGHLGHWTTAKQSLDSLSSGCSRYEPSLRFGEAVGDLRRMVVPGLGEGQVYGAGIEASEEVARMVEGAGMVARHLAPLLVSLPPARHFTSALHISTWSDLLFF